MPILTLILLAIVQGITEFLPISSSGHLELVHEVIGETPDDFLFDIAVHVGTLLAVIVYFWRDVWGMIQGGMCFILRRPHEKKSLSIHILLASIPVIIVGFLIYTFIPEFFRSLSVIAWTTLIFGILLGWVDKVSTQKRTIENMGWKDALFIGFAQCLSLIPGTSRSGITMTAARFLGISRTQSARFSLLLGTVAISGAGTLGSLDLMDAENVHLTLDVVFAAILSFVAAIIAVTLMMRWLKQSSFMPFVIYRVILGIILLGIVYL